MSDSAPRPGSEAEWEALLRQLRHQPKAQPRPFFYARVQARLHAPAAAARAWHWLRRPAYAAILSAMILAISGDGSVAATAHDSLPGGQPTQQLPR